jgi:hypothetical protein
MSGLPRISGREYIKVLNKTGFLLSIPMLLLALGIYTLVLFLPPPISTIQLFVKFDFGVAFVLLCGFALIFQKKGLLWETVGLTSILLLLGTSLIYKWQIATNDGAMFGGLLTFSDANEYYTSAEFLLHGNNLSAFGTRRPLFSSLLSALLAGSGNNLQIALATMVALSGIALFFASREIQRVHNSFSASAFILICYWFYHPFIGSTMSENLGLCLGCIGLTFLVKGGRRELLGIEIVLGFFALTLALNARAGAFFILPALLAWIGISAHKKTINWRYVLLAVIAISAGMIANAILVKTIGSKDGAAFSNYSYTLYGLASGYKGWWAVLSDHPNATEKEIYLLAFEMIKSKPSVFAAGILKSYQDYFTSVDGAFNFMRLVGERKNQAYPLFWGLTVITLFFSLLWRKQKAYSLALLSFLGIVASAGLLPPIDSDYMRVYASTIPFTAYIVSTAFAIPQRLVQMPVVLIPDSNRHVFSTLLIPFTGVLLTLCLVGPILVKETGVFPTNKLSISCSQAQKAIIFSVGSNSSVKIVQNDAVYESYLPNFRVTDFYRSITNGLAYGNYPFLDEELLSLKSGNVVSAVTFYESQKLNSNSLEVGYLVTTGGVPQSGTYYLCVTPSKREELKNKWFYYAGNLGLKQKTFQVFSQNNLFLIGIAKVLYELGSLCVLFLLLVPQGTFHLHSWKQHLLIAMSLVLIIVAIATYLHRTALFPLAWQRETLDATNAEPVEGYFYQFPLGMKWMGQESMGESPVIIYEDGVPLAHPNSKFYAIKKVGAGRFTVQKGYLFFSTSDNGDPRYNKKLYEIYWPTPIPPLLESIIYIAAFTGVVFLAKYNYSFKKQRMKTAMSSPSQN